MSKRSRIAVAVLISLLVIVGIFSTVQGASMSARQDKAGAHMVSGALVNLDHYRESAPAPAAAPSDLRSEFGGHGGGCEFESQSSPLD